MPIYEYVCRKGHEFEEMQPFSAEPVARCPECGTKAQRKISLAAFHLKGSGWYLTDSRSASSSAEVPEQAAGSEKQDSSQETRSPESDKSAGSGAAATSGESDQPVRSSSVSKKHDPLRSARSRGGASRASRGVGTRSASGTGKPKVRKRGV